MPIQDVDKTGVDLTSTGTVAELEPAGKTRLTTILENAGGAVDEVSIQVRERDGTWRTLDTFSAVSTIQDTREVSGYGVRIQITSSSLTGGETGDFYVAAGD